jgi:HSP20 family protein
MARLPVLRTTPLFSSVVREMDEMQNRLRRFLQEGFPFEPLPVTESLGWTPVVEIVENDKEYVLTAELPGLKKDNVEVQYQDGVLTIRGEKKEERKEGNGDSRYLLWERSYGAFQRSFTLPSDVDANKIEAAFSDGVLTVRMPKTAEARTKGRKIEIKAS